jgi:hypothetical protein
VEVFEVKEDNTKISTSVFVQVLSKLSGQPLLPSLKTLRISNMHSFFGYGPLLVHPSLELVKVDIKPSESEMGVSISTVPSHSIMEAFLQLLITESPKIQDLHIDYSPPLIISSVTQIRRLVNLRALDIGPFTGIRDISEITMLLKPMNLLEQLRFLVRPVSGYQLTPSDAPTLHMANLVSLTVVAPSQFLTEFMVQLDAPRLTSLNLSQSVTPKSVGRSVRRMPLWTCCP